MTDLIRASDVGQVARSRLWPAGLFLGAGLGGFLDGIVLHQLLQWHNMVSNRIPPASTATLRQNVFWDGAFHVFAWLMTIAGLILLWRAIHAGALPPARVLVGMAIFGLGLFNLVEGVLNHHLLGLHHVREVANPAAWDIGFLVAGGLLPLAIGWWLSRPAQTPA
jgi:uncharacterized membrane protein